jgi:molybdopterin-guanine dinucleotide biosynthesis protein A
MQHKLPLSGVILAGGQNSRVNGQKKTFFTVGGDSIFDRIYSVMNNIFEDLMLVTRTPECFLQWDINIVPDIFDIHCPLNGIYSGLFFASTPHIFVIACDIPFISFDLINYICSSYDTSYDVYMPKTIKGEEPLCAIYSKQCLNRFKTCLQQERYKITRCLNGFKTGFIDDTTLPLKDKQFHSFFNVNTSEDLAYANILVEKLNEGELK